MNTEIRTETTYTLADLTDLQMDTLTQALRCYNRCLTQD